MLVLRSVSCFRISCKTIPEIPVRNFVSNPLNRVVEPNKDHLFKKVWTKNELIDYLCSNVYYEDGNCVVVNKPYGVLARIDRTKPIQFEGGSIACECSLSDILSELGARFNSADLRFVTHPQWIFSGLTIFSKNNSNSKSDILKNFKNIINMHRTYSFLAIVLGDTPTVFENSFRISKDFEFLEKKNKKIKSFIIRYKHKVLGSSNGTHLVTVSLNYNYLNILRLILATKCFSPVLGDFVYSSRMMTLFKVPLLVPPEQSHVKKALPPEIMKLLRLSQEEIDCCPCHVHLYSTTLTVKNNKFVAAVPPPEYFVWTCEQLGLKEVKHFFRGVEDYNECREAIAHGR